MFTSDHGCHFRTRNDEYKRSCHESCIRIPLVIYGPGFNGGAVREELVSLVDLPPTLLEVGGAQVPAGWHGRSLVPLASGLASDWPEEVFLQISESQVARSVRTHRWKYCVDAPGCSGVQDAASPLYVEQYLYELQADPHEQHNLVGDPAYRAVCDELAATLVRRMVAAGEAAPRIVAGSRP